MQTICLNSTVIQQSCAMFIHNTQLSGKLLFSLRCLGYSTSTKFPEASLAFGLPLKKPVVSSSVGFNSCRHHRKRGLPRSLGYRLKPSAWGKGYATEGSKALIHKGFTELGCSRVITTALIANKASIRVMQKAGLQFEKYWTYHSRAGVDEPAVMYSLLRQDWNEIM